MKKNISVLFLSLLMSACTPKVVEKVYDKQAQRETCRLQNIPIYSQLMGWSTPSRYVRLSFEVKEFDNVLLGFRVITPKREMQMLFNPRIVFNVYSGNNIIHEMPIKGVSAINHLYAHLVNFEIKESDYAEIILNKKEFDQIQSAEKLTILIETNLDPLKIELSKEDLQPFQYFNNECLK